MKPSPSQRQLRQMTERSFFPIGWPVTGCSRPLNVRATPHVNGGLWPILLKKSPCDFFSFSARKSASQIVLQTARARRSRVRRPLKNPARTTVSDFFNSIDPLRSVKYLRSGHSFVVACNRLPSHSRTNRGGRWQTPMPIADPTTHRVHVAWNDRRAPRDAQCRADATTPGAVDALQCARRRMA
jgi:hypothetical protein